MTFTLALVISLLIAFVATLWVMSELGKRYSISRGMWSVISVVVFSILQWVLQGAMTGDF